MTNMIEKTLRWLGEQLSGRLSMPGDDGYAAATAIWAKPVGPQPRVIAHCRTPEDVQAAVRAARYCHIPVSVRGGGYDWAGRALCDGLVIDLSGMNSVVVDPGKGIARISGGTRASDILAVTDPLHLAAVTGSVRAFGMAGLTLGGGYGPLIGRFGLTLDNLLSAQVVLADGRIVTTQHDKEEDLFWALRGGGGNFGVVTAMQHQLHHLPSVCSGMLLFPYREAKSVLEGCANIAASAPEELTAQVGFAIGSDEVPVVMVVPTWCGLPEQGDAQVAPFLKLGTPLVDAVATKSYSAALATFDAFAANGRRTFMETCWIPELDSSSIDIFVEAMETAVSPGCAIITHEFRGAASRVPVKATAFGMRRDHVLVEILSSVVGSGELEEKRHQNWARAILHAFDRMALPGGHPNFLVRSDDDDRVAQSYGCNAERLNNVKRRYDPDNIFRSATPLPVTRTIASATA